jgi:hypothetical protein
MFLCNEEEIIQKIKFKSETEKKTLFFYTAHNIGFLDSQFDDERS